ncbi:hypothetical protein [Pseudarthrobacter albicanus]|uniref:hypothetical protein n=1 Tax=Pseudarthrobacter albicanus TaxID=2823873 RepID=UPI001BA6D8D7|nr:hypothetical protein [Pseudarthrobacter albicanus]
MRTAVKSRGVIAMALCGIAGLLAGSLYFSVGHPAFAVLSLGLFTLMAVTAQSQLVSMRWVQETEARKSRSRFRELRDMLGGISQSVQRTPETRVATAAAKPPVSPGPAPSTGGAIGRLAAAVMDDRQRQSKILGYLGVPPAAPWGGRVIYSILGGDLSRYLGDAHALEALRPSTIAAQIANGSGSALIVDDTAFASGSWFGADSAAGTLLANEVLQALAECRSQGMPVYFVRTRRAAEIYTRDFEAASDVVFSDRSSMNEWTEDYKFGLLNSLETFVKMKKEALIGSH